MGKQALAGTRLNAFAMDPDDLTIVTDKKHPLYDERVNLPLDESLVLNIMAYGVLEPVLVRKVDDEQAEVLDGRQRVRAAREANRRLSKEGKTTIRVPVMVKKGEEHHLFGVLISTNENRQDDAPLAKARKAARFMDMGRSEAEAAIAFGVSKSTITSWLKLLTLDTELLAGVDRGEVSASEALKVADSGATAQKRLATKAKTQPTKKGRPKGSTNGVPTRAKLKAKYSALHKNSDASITLSWVLGIIDEPEFDRFMTTGKP